MVYLFSYYNNQINKSQENIMITNVRLKKITSVMSKNKSASSKINTIWYQQFLNYVKNYKLVGYTWNMYNSKNYYFKTPYFDLKFNLLI